MARLGQTNAADYVAYRPRWSGLLALFPTTYAWQIYGWLAGVVAYFIVAIVLYEVGVVAFLRRWSNRWLRNARGVIMIISIIVIGVRAIDMTVTLFNHTSVVARQHRDIVPRKS